MGNGYWKSVLKSQNAGNLVSQSGAIQRAVKEKQPLSRPLQDPPGPSRKLAQPTADTTVLAHCTQSPINVANNYNPPLRHLLTFLSSSFVSSVRL